MADKKLEIEVDIKTKTPEPAKVPVEQPAPVKIDADTSPAEGKVAGLFASIRRGVTAVRASISSVFAAFGMVTFAIMGVQTLIAGFVKLHDMLTATSRAIQQMRWDSWVDGFNRAADSMIGKHRMIIDLLRKEQDVANKAASLRAASTSQTRAEEDQARGQTRAAALAAAADPRERGRLEDRFAEEDDRIAKSRFEQDRRERLARLDDEESMYRSKEKGARGRLTDIDREIENQEQVVNISYGTIRNGGDKEKYQKYIDEANKRIAALKDERKATEELIETMKREADYRAAEAKIVSRARAPVGGEAVREARRSAQETADREAQGEFERTRTRARDDADFEREMRDLEHDAARPGATKKEIAASEDRQIELLNRREAEARERLAEAERTLAAELEKPAAERDEKTLSRAREDIRTNEDVARNAADRRTDIETARADRQDQKQVDRFKALADEIESSRPKDRLTAMGLSSGAGANRAIDEIHRNVGRMCTLLERQIKATEKIQNAEATY